MVDGLVALVVQAPLVQAMAKRVQTPQLVFLEKIVVSMHQQRTSGQAGKEKREKKKMEWREGKEKGKVRGKEERISHGDFGGLTSKIFYVQRGNGKEQKKEKKEKGGKEEEEKVEEVERT